MSDYLLELDFTESEIKEFMNEYESMLNTDITNIQNKLQFLKELEFNNSEIKNIILANPLYLNKTDEELDNLIDNFKNYGINDIKNLINANPCILNLDGIDIELFFNKK